MRESVPTAVSPLVPLLLVLTEDATAAVFIIVPLPPQSSHLRLC